MYKAVIGRQADAALVAQEIGGVQQVDVQRVALDPLAAVEEPAQLAQRLASVMEPDAQRLLVEPEDRGRLLRPEPCHLAQQQHLRQTTTTGGQIFRQDDKREQLSFDFHNGGETTTDSFNFSLADGGENGADRWLGEGGSVAADAGETRPGHWMPGETTVRLERTF